MKNSFQITLFFIYLSLTFTACGQDTINPINVYESCCGIEPVEFYVEHDSLSAYLYVPNVFTPNGDGINDVFMPIMNSGVYNIGYFEIQKESPDDTTSAVLYTIVDIDPRDMFLKAWNGLDQNGNPFKGPFKYEISIATTDGLNYKVQGRGCAVICEPNAVIFQNKEGCFYPSQTNLMGHLDSTIINGESTCFTPQ